MLSKKFYFPIGLCVLLVLAIGFLSLRSDVPDEPTKIYKAVEPQAKPKAETPVAKSQDGHLHADSTWHNQPHTEKTAQEKFNQEMREKMALKEQELAKYNAETAKYKAETAKYKAETAKYKAELDRLKAEAAERTEYLSRITEKGKEFVAQFPDMLEMIPETYLALSETEQEKFLLRCVEYDLFVEELQGIVNSTPQWILDEWDDKQPGVLDEFLNLPSLTELYGSL